MKILYATDGSEGALCAGRFLARLPRQSDAYVHIVTVLPTGVLEGDVAEEEADTDGEEILSAARAAVGGFPGHITAAATRAGNSTGAIVEAILLAAMYIGADLIVVGASGWSAFARFFLGSVSEGLVRHADCPVLVARGGDESPLREVILGIDGSETARNAAGWVAGTLPLPESCVLRLVRVVTPPAWVNTSSGPVRLETKEALKQAIREGAITTSVYLEPVAKDLAGSGGHAVLTEVRAGHADSELLQAVREKEAGLLVVGSHGLSGLERFLMGSISDKVVRHAPCSVLVYRQADTRVIPSLFSHISVSQKPTVSVR